MITDDLTSSIWTIIEDNVAIICACLPMCRGPLSMLFPSLLTSRGTANSSSGDSNYYSTTETIRGTSSAKLDGWSPFSGGRKLEGTFQMTIMRTELHESHGSDELALVPKTDLQPKT